MNRLQSQPARYRLSILISDSLTQVPISGIRAEVHPGAASKFTDSTGKINFLLNEDAYHITLYKNNHALGTFFILLKNDTFCEYYLSLENEQLSAVVFRPIHEHGHFLQTGHENIIPNAVRNVGVNTLAGLLQSAGGVSMIRQGALQKPVVRGFSGSRVVTMWEDVRLEGQQWGLEHAPEVDPALIESLDLQRGAGGVEAGPGAMGGVIRMRGQEWESPGDMRLRASTGVESNGRGRMMMGSYGQSAHNNGWSWKMAGVYRTSGDQHTPDYVLSNTGFRIQNMVAGVAWVGKKWQHEFEIFRYQGDFGILRAAHTGSPDDLRRAIQSDTPLIIRPYTRIISFPRQEVGHIIGRYALEFHPHRDVRWDLRTAWQHNIRKEFDLYRGAGNAALRPTAYLQLMTQSWDVLRTHESGRWHWLLGTGGQYQVNSNLGRALVIPGYALVWQSIYGMARMPGKWEFGARMDLQWQKIVLISPNREERKKMSGFSATMVRHVVKNKIKSEAMVHAIYRQPGASEWYANGLHGTTATFEIGNPLLKPEAGLQAEWQSSFAFQRIKWKVRSYLYYFFNYIYLMPDTHPTQTIRGTFPTFRYQSAPAYMMGSEWMCEYAINSRHILDFQFNGIYAMIPVLGVSPYHIPPVKSQLGYTFKSSGKRHWELCLIAMYIFQKNTRIQPFDYMLPPEGYGLFNLNAKLPIQFKSHLWDLQLSIQNVSNQRYRDYLSRYRYFANENALNISIKILYQFKQHQNH